MKYKITNINDKEGTIYTTPDAVIELKNKMEGYIKNDNPKGHLLAFYKEQILICEEIINDFKK
ncbi:MAG: hypothetical protein ACRCW9_05955 [Cetobacterium sp.]